jgi:AraC family transcriptional regulator
LQQLKVSAPRGAGVATYPAGATFGPRLMRDWEWVWLIEGAARYRHGEQIVQAPPGSIVLCRPGATDFFWWDTTQHTRHAYFHFEIEQIPHDWPPIETWPLVREAAEGDIMRPLFRHFLTWHGRGDQMLIQLTMQHMLTAWVQGQTATRDVPTQALPEAVERAYQYLQRRLEAEPTTSISLGDLAREACVSREHLCRVFKETTGRSPAETVRMARLDRAAILLARSNYSVNEIARLCGFASPFHFSRQFKAAFHLSPTALRDAVQDGATPPVPLLIQHFRHS